LLTTPSTDPDGRSLAHPVLIADAFSSHLLTSTMHKTGLTLQPEVPA
jgi:hypothetical protein